MNKKIVCGGLTTLAGAYSTTAFAIKAKENFEDSVALDSRVLREEAQTRGFLDVLVGIASLKVCKDGLKCLLLGIAEERLK